MFHKPEKRPLSNSFKAPVYSPDYSVYKYRQNVRDRMMYGSQFIQQPVSETSLLLLPKLRSELALCVLLRTSRLSQAVYFNPGSLVCASRLVFSSFRRRFQWHNNTFNGRHRGVVLDLLYNGFLLASWLVIQHLLPHRKIMKCCFIRMPAHIDMETDKAKWRHIKSKKSRDLRMCWWRHVKPMWQNLTKVDLLYVSTKTSL